LMLLPTRRRYASTVMINANGVTAKRAQAVNAVRKSRKSPPRLTSSLAQTSCLAGPNASGNAQRLIGWSVD
jgi:hypothetical protein